LHGRCDLPLCRPQCSPCPANARPPALCPSPRLSVELVCKCNKARCSGPCAPLLLGYPRPLVAHAAAALGTPAA
jgi:hypothetical protein